MKKLYYGIYNEKEEIYRHDGTERYLITVSSSAEEGDAIGSVTGETGGSCFGPADCPEWVEDFINENLEAFEEMDQEEEEERVSHLAEEWGLEKEELNYLR